MRRFLANISTIDHDYYEPRSSNINLHDDKCHIDLEHFYNCLSSYGSRISLSLTGTTDTKNGSLQDYHSISTSSTITTEKSYLSIESLQSASPSSSQQLLVHSISRQSLQQRLLFVLNNGYMTRSAQSLASSNINISNTNKNSSATLTAYYCLKTNDEFSGTTKRQSILPSQQQLLPKLGVKALDQTSSNKNIVLPQRSPILNLYQEEKCRRIEFDKQPERLGNKLNRSNE
ncbi:unnamed protein product [Rotaria sp. Silwood2]|nr:unnamed protein product [Rotaria sp. Silwood2]CAF4401279.1 unnamed protein product [Rotaria sp. Silwood2]